MSATASGDLGGAAAAGAPPSDTPIHRKTAPKPTSDRSPGLFHTSAMNGVTSAAPSTSAIAPLYEPDATFVPSSLKVYVPTSTGKQTSVVVHRSGTSASATAGIGPIAARSAAIFPAFCCVSTVQEPSSFSTTEWTTGSHEGYAAFIGPIIPSITATGSGGAPGGLKTASSVATAAAEPSKKPAMKARTAASFGGTGGGAAAASAPSSAAGDVDGAVGGGAASAAASSSTGGGASATGSAVALPARAPAAARSGGAARRERRGEDHRQRAPAVCESHDG